MIRRKFIYYNIIKNIIKKWNYYINEICFERSADKEIEPPEEILYLRKRIPNFGRFGTGQAIITINWF